MKVIFCFIFIVISVFSVFSQKHYIDNYVLPSHPRLLLLNGEERLLKENIKRDVLWTDIHNTVMNEADSIVVLPVNERNKIGRRLLGVSRENLKRIFILSYAYRMTKNKIYAQRAEQEMLKASSFVDWNPNHFLDVGEMTMALAIGYDWLYSYLSEKSKDVIKNAIIEKGLMPSFDSSYNRFVNLVHNWNQVCHAGVAFGALAIWEEDKVLSCKTINRAIEKISIPMKHYSPDGVYPEGPGYWEYGTSFNVMFLGAIEKIFNTDFGLSDIPGFINTGEYILHTLTPSLRNFNYSDNNTKASVSATPFWFYNKTGDSSVLYNQIRLYNKYGLGSIQRLAPAMLIWGASAPLNEPEIPNKCFWKGGGDNPIVCMRSTWASDTATFLGVKLGSPKVNHGHMDVGSFILESNGIDWLIDLGSENYNHLETKGVDLWRKDQNSQRWDVFRYNNYAHNTLTFNEKLQNVDGKAEILSFSDNLSHMYAVSDLTSIYKDQVKSVCRAYSLINGKYVVVEDKISTQNRFTKMTWTMVTKSQPKIISENVLLLENNGKKMYVKVEADNVIKWNIKPAKSSYSYDSPNNGVNIITFDSDLKVNSNNSFSVYFLPDVEIVPNYVSLLN